MPYAPLPSGSGGGGGGITSGSILPASMTTGTSTGSCRPVLLDGVDLSMSTIQHPTALLPSLSGQQQTNNHHHLNHLNHHHHLQQSSHHQPMTPTSAPGLLSLPVALAAAAVMSRSSPSISTGPASITNTTQQTLSLPASLTHREQSQREVIGITGPDDSPNPDVLLALLARNKKLEGKDYYYFLLS